jgi:hypothetical protein
MKKTILQDANGNISSKRIAGVCTLATAGIMAGILFYFSISSGVKDPDTAIRIINGFLTTGGVLLGVGIFEKVGKK